jgi:hypothetical protein
MRAPWHAVHLMARSGMERMKMAGTHVQFAIILSSTFAASVSPDAAQSGNIIDISMSLSFLIRVAIVQ